MLPHVHGMPAESDESLVLLSSRSTLRSSFANHQSPLLRGSVPWSGHLCQKQPSMKTAGFARVNATSRQLSEVHPEPRASPVKFAPGLVQTAWASSVNAAATRSAAGTSTASSKCPRRRFCMNAWPAMITCAVRSVSPRIGLSRVLELAVIGLDGIVRVPFDVMPCRWDQVVQDDRVDRGGIGDDLTRCHLQHRQRPVQEAAGAVGIAVG